MNIASMKLQKRLAYYYILTSLLWQKGYTPYQAFAQSLRSRLPIELASRTCCLPEKDRGWNNAFHTVTLFSSGHILWFLTSRKFCQSLANAPVSRSEPGRSGNVRKISQSDTSPHHSALTSVSGIREGARLMSKQLQILNERGYPAPFGYLAWLAESVWKNTANFVGTELEWRPQTHNCRDGSS